MRAIGVSNFKPGHLERLRAETGVVPEVNQIQLNPLMRRDEARAYHAEHRRGPPGATGDYRPRLAVREDAGAGRSAMAPELGVVAIPKSADPERLRRNIEVFDFELTPEEVEIISSLDDGTLEPADSDRVGH